MLDQQEKNLEISGKLNQKNKTQSLKINENNLKQNEDEQ